MMHWVRAFVWCALGAAPFVLARGWGAVAALLVCVFAALAGLALLTHGLGKLRYGGYSSERAAWVLSAAFLCVCAADVWLQSG